MQPPLDRALSERSRLVSIAFRMLGTIAEAEDAVQETYLRWYRLSDAERAEISNAQAWLTRAVSRVCLTQLASARSRREQYVGPWLPEPVPAGSFAPMRSPESASGHSRDAAALSTASAASDPLESVVADESISSALLLMLESMTPAERVAFVLHDVFALAFTEVAEVVDRSPAACRQLAASARRRVAAGRRRQAPRTQHAATIRAFEAAARSGDIAGLVAVLDPDVELRSDGGGVISAARRPVLGADRVSRFLLGALSQAPDATIDLVETGDGLGFAVRLDGQVSSVATFDVHEGRVTAVRMMRNPAKLTQWLRSA